MATQEVVSAVQRLGYVGIDFGSTATRAVVAVNEIDRKTRRVLKTDVYHIQDTRARDDTSKRFDRGEFPSLGCPLDGPPFLVGFNAANQVAKRTISLKSLVYFLTDNEDNHPFTAALIEHYLSLPSQNEQAAFKEDLRSMLLHFLQDIVEQTLAKAEEEDFEVRTISLCIPNTWSTRENNIQDFFSPILDEPIAGTGIETTYSFEAAARANYLVTRYPRQLKGHDYLMVLDFGGHSMGSWHGVLRWTNDGLPALYSPPNSDFGVRGGYEIWEIEIGKLIRQKMTKDWRAKERFAEEHRNIIGRAFLDKIFQDKTNFPWDRPIYRLHVDVQNVLPELKKHTFAIDLPMEELKEAWRVGYRKILDLAKDCISRYTKKEEIENVYVLLSGGSIANPKARKELTDFCGTWGRLRSHGGTETRITLKFMEDIQTVGWKWTLAEGAALALANTMDGEQFWDRGGVLAIQSTTPKGSFTVATSGSAKLFFRKDAGSEQHFPVEITLTEGKIIRIIAHPNFKDAQNTTNPLQVFSKDCYDVWEFTRNFKSIAEKEATSLIPDGSYALEVSNMKYDERDAVLTLRLRSILLARKRGSKRLKKETTNGCFLKGAQFLSFEVPLVSHGESNIVVVDCDRMRGRCWMLSADREAAGPATRLESKQESSIKADLKNGTGPEKEDGTENGDPNGYDSYDDRPVRRSKRQRRKWVVSRENFSS